MKPLPQIRSQLPRIRELARKPEAQLFAVAENVSAWSAAEHLDHILKVSTAIVGRVRAENPPAETKGISLIGRIVLAIGWIPRGRGEAPMKLIGQRVAGAELEAALAKLEESVESITPAMLALRAPTVRHPMFGGLTPAQALRFVAIHNAHHLRIVDEILRGA